METNNWPIINDRIVLYLDLMGFKDLVQNVPPKRLYDHLLDVTRFTSEMKYFGYAGLERNGFTELPQVKFQVFSDSIVFVSEGITSNDIYIITQGAKWVSTILFQNHLPFKGAVAIGTMTFDDNNNIFFGQPLIDAFLLEQQLDLFGIIVHHTFEYLLKKTFKNQKCMDCLQDFVPYKIHTKNGYAKHLILDWIRFAEKIHGKTFHEEIYSKLSSQMSGSPKSYLDNTYSFFKECLDRPFLDRD